MKAVKWTIPPIILAALFIAVILAPLSGCGASTREKTLQTTFVSINSARDGFVAFDQARQKQIVDEAKTLEDGKAALEVYRKRRERALSLFEGVYRALTAATLANDDDKSLIAMLAVAATLKEALEDLKKSTASTPSTPAPMPVPTPLPTLPATTNP